MADQSQPSPRTNSVLACMFSKTLGTGESASGEAVKLNMKLLVNTRENYTAQVEVNGLNRRHDTGTAVSDIYKVRLVVCCVRRGEVTDCYCKVYQMCVQ
jgi:hypothetical protein